MSDAGLDRWVLEVLGVQRPPAGMPRAGVLVVGCDDKRAGYVVTGEGVEDAHCAIGRTKGGGYAVKDLGSRSGTFLNGRRVESARLSAGDEIGIGTATLRVVDPDDPGRRPSAAARADDTQEPAAAAAKGAAAASQVAEAPPPRASGTGDTAMRTAPLPAIPGYRIEKRIGRGGMGDVYLAVQESLARQVALKVLAARFEADREFVRRFQAEARAAAALNHPNVVTVYDVGESDGKHYLSMEYMDRGNLEDRLRNGARMSETEVLDILRDATAGLVYAESRGIVHRDLKPANLMQNHVGATKIADLGLATHVESEEQTSADKKVFGTPHFMSPEQARGERLDSRSDLYSLGATAYRLLTGCTPYEGKEAREIVRALLRDEPRPVRDIAPDTSPGVVALVERLMKKDPAERFASAVEVQKEIERLRAPPPRAVSLAGEAAPRKKRTASRAVLVLLLLGCGGWLWWQAKQDQAANPQRGGQPDPLAVTPAPPDDGAPAQPESTDGGSAPTVQPAVAQGTTAPDKDDKDLQLLEANAKLALLELRAKELTQTQLRDELRVLASRFQGTSAATEANEAADAITAEMRRVEAERAAKKIEIDAIMVKLKEAARLEDDPPHPGKSFLAMRAVEGQAPLKDDPQFIEARKSLELIVSRTAVLHAQKLLGQATERLDKGDFEGGMAKFKELMPVFDLPEFPMGEAPAGVTELFEIGRTARERMHTIEASREVFERRRERDDAITIAQGFNGASGLERELRAMDFDAARQRLEKLAAKVSGPDSRAFLEEQAADCKRAAAVLETLARECSAGNWRRKSFVDPRERRGITRNAIGADSVGLLYEGANGTTDHVPWSAFGGNTHEIARLFSERCTRDWTSEELNSIAALLRIQACVQVVDLATKMLDGTKKANFTDANQREMADAFAEVTAWVGAAPKERDEIAREAAAANVLAGALRLTTDGKWSSAVAETERLLTEFKDSLLVRLLSDGQAPEDMK